MINNERCEAKPGLEGVCPGCSQPVIAKCGKQRVHHWAHRSNRGCDNWWEPETEWHRAWKNNFPADWQEVFLPDVQTGEKHVADIRSSHGLVIEFQHSRIDPNERALREKFYQNMIWVVDGTRLKRDFSRFVKGSESMKFSGIQGFFFVYFPEECFPADWLESSVPVIFDFRGVVLPIDQQDLMRDTLWCVLPGRAVNRAVVVAILRADFVSRVIDYPTLFPNSTHELVNTFANNIRQTQMMEERRQMGMSLQRRPILHTRKQWKGRRRFRF